MNILGFLNGRRLAVIGASLAAAALLSACGGSKTTSSVTPTVSPYPTLSPAAGTTTTASNTPIQQLVLGSYAWVSSTTNHTLYYLTIDTPTGAACTGGCIQVWPPDYANAYAVPSGNFTVVTRSDGLGKQWAYNGHPLYMYSGDTGPDQSHGNGLAFDGGTWFIARPTLTAATPTPMPTHSAAPTPSPTYSP